MVEHLATMGTLNAPRKHRFSEQFHDDILNMVALLTSDIIKKHKKVNLKRQRLYVVSEEKLFFLLRFKNLWKTK